MRTAQLLFSAIAMFLFVGRAVADGMVFPEDPINLTEVKSRIPSQRAILKFDGQEQILLIESTVNGPAGNYGWVVPLPARPSYVKAVKPEYIEGTFQAVKPPIMSLPTQELGFLIIGSLFATALFLTAGLRYRQLDAGWRVTAFAGEALILSLFYLFLMHGPSGSKGEEVAAGAMPMDRAKTGNELSVESLGSIGSYEVSVLKGQGSGPVLEWLKAHKISVPEKAGAAIDAYAKEGWVFLAAEIRKDEDRPLPPHPLKAVFPTDKAIYPMRLTGTQSGPIHLELAIVGRSKAHVDGMETWSCKNDSVLVSVPTDARQDERLYDEWDGNLYAMAKNGMVVTYLREDIQPDDMQRDFAIEWQQYEREVVEVYDTTQAKDHAKSIGFKWLPWLAFVFGAIGIFWPVKAHQIAIVGFAASALLSALVGGGWLWSVKTVETEQSTSPYGRSVTERYH